MIRKRSVKDTVNPPGQVRYLRDVIAKYEREIKEETKAESAVSEKEVNSLAHVLKRTWITTIVGEDVYTRMARAVLTFQKGLDKVG